MKQDQHIDTQQLSDFIYELNIARRQFALYPVGHPQISSSNTRALDKLEKLFELIDTIAIGVSPGKLMFRDEWLDPDNPVYKDFSNALSGMGIVSLAFERGLSLEQLIDFNKLLALPKGMAEGDFQRISKEIHFQHVVIEFIDYENFQESSVSPKNKDFDEDVLWEDLLRGLGRGLLDTEGKPLTLQERLSREDVLDAFEQFAIQSKEQGIPYEKAISFFIAGLSPSATSGKSDSDTKIADLADNMSSTVKSGFFNSSLHSLGQRKRNSLSHLDSAAHDNLLQVLKNFNDADGHISGRILDLLGTFQKNKPGNYGFTTVSQPAELKCEAATSPAEILLLEDNHDDYMPPSYQESLKTLLTGKLSSSLPSETITMLKRQFAEIVNERHLGTILFHILQEGCDVHSEATIQDNLAKLAQFALDIGDYQNLNQIFSEWSRYLYSGKGHARFLDESVLAKQTDATFMNAVLDSIERWGPAKYKEICAYIGNVGEPYVELLIHRLAIDESMNNRKIWMQLLTDLGPVAYPLIIENLETDSWYLARNLILVLGKQKNLRSVKKILEFADHNHPKVRKEAMRALYHFNPETANRLLFKELKTNRGSSILEMLSLATIAPDQHILEKLHYLFEQDYRREEDLELKKRLIDTLVKIGNEESIPVLFSVMNQQNLITPRWQKELREELWRSLKHYGRDSWEAKLGKRAEKNSKGTA